MQKRHYLLLFCHIDTGEDDKFSALIRFKWRRSNLLHPLDCTVHDLYALGKWTGPRGGSIEFRLSTIVTLISGITFRTLKADANRQWCFRVRRKCWRRRKATTTFCSGREIIHIQQCSLPSPNRIRWCFWRLAQPARWSIGAGWRIKSGARLAKVNLNVGRLSSRKYGVLRKPITERGKTPFLWRERGVCQCQTPRIFL